MFPLRDGCPECGNAQVETVALADSGVVWTFTLVHVAPPGFTGACPYALGIVQLDDDLRVTTVITTDDLETIRIGDRVRFELLNVGGDDEPRWTFAHRQCVDEVA